MVSAGSVHARARTPYALRPTWNDSSPAPSAAFSTT
jgi:hypothetical protein